MTEGETVMRRLVDAFNRRDFVAGIRGLAPDVELQDYPGLPDEAWHHGLDGAGEWTAKLLATAPDLRIEPSDFQQVGDRFLYAWRITGMAGRSSVPVSFNGYGVGTLSAGKLARLELYTGRHEALAALAGNQRQ